MTARRRRKSGSGPSAPALIAWVGGTGIGTDRTADIDSTNGGSSLANLALYLRAPLTARGRGLAAGTLLACGSMLAVTVHAADSSLTPSGVPPPGLATAVPQAVSAGSGGTAPLVGTQGWSGAASASSGQALAGTYFPAGEVRHHVPLALRASGLSPSEATQPLSLSLPGTDEAQAPESVPVDRMLAPVAQVPAAPVGTPLAAPVAQVVIPAAQQSDPVQDLVAPEEQDVAASEEGTQPAMTMLSPLVLDLSPVPSHS